MTEIICRRSSLPMLLADFVFQTRMDGRRRETASRRFVILHGHHRRGLGGRRGNLRPSFDEPVLVSLASGRPYLAIDASQDPAPTSRALRPVFLGDQACALCYHAYGNRGCGVGAGPLGGRHLGRLHHGYRATMTLVGGLILSDFDVGRLRHRDADGTVVRRRGHSFKGLPSGGRLIGLFSNAGNYPFLLILAAQPAGIGFLIAAKVNRSAVLDATSKGTRRPDNMFMVGTLASIRLGHCRLICNAGTPERAAGAWNSSRVALDRRAENGGAPCSVFLASRRSA